VSLDAMPAADAASTRMRTSDATVSRRARHGNPYANPPRSRPSSRSHKSKEIAVKRSATTTDASVFEANDVARITRYLTEAVADGDISRAAAEGAILDWTRDVRVLDAAVRRCPDGDSVLLLQRVVGRCRAAA
jgi:hypothetical protein